MNEPVEGYAQALSSAAKVLSTWDDTCQTCSMKSTRSLYHGHRYPREIVSHAVWLAIYLGIDRTRMIDWPLPTTSRHSCRIPLDRLERLFIEKK